MKHSTTSSSTVCWTARSAPDDAPPGLSTVAALVERAAGDPSPAELAGGSAVVAALAAVLPDAGGVPEPRRSSLMQGVVRAKLAAAIVVSAVGVGAAAAAVGTIASPGRSDHSGVMEAGAATTVTSPASAPPTTIEVTVPTTPPSTASHTTVAAVEEFTVAAAEASVAAPADLGLASAPSTSGPSAPKMAAAEVFGLCTALQDTEDKLGPPALAKIKAAAAQSGRSLKNFCERVIAAKKGQHDGDAAADEGERDAGQREQHGPPDEPGNGRGSGQGSGGRGRDQGQGNDGSQAGKGRLRATRRSPLRDPGRRPP